MTEYDVDKQIEKSRDREPLFLGSKRDPVTGDLVGSPTIGRSTEDEDER